MNQGRMSQRLLPYLRLVRAPAVFSAIGDPLTGMLISGTRLPAGRALALGIASAATYLGGMALNDFADREEDARERPQRPIPSGAVSPEKAAVLGGALLGIGLGAATAAGARRTAPALAAAVLSYDFALKGTSAGPVAMGACRALSLLTGAEAVAGRKGVRQATGSAVLLAGYVAGLTVLAQGETGENGNQTALPGVVLSSATVLAAVGRGGSRALPWGLAVAALAGAAAVRAAREPSPRTAGPAVGALIRAIPALDAALAAPRAPLKAALIAAPLLALTRWGRRLIPIS